ncbi:MAG: hypothetical protein RI958_3103, partial [Actinomycetota bacterium]
AGRGDYSAASDPVIPRGIGTQGLVSLTPVRVFDTRPGLPDGAVVVAKKVIGGATVLKVKVAGVGGVPLSGVAAVSLNVTVTEPVGNGFLTVYPCGRVPQASNLNFVRNQTIPNSVIAPLSANGEVCFYSNVNTHVLADVSGWFKNGISLNPVDPVRVFDTRQTEPQGAVGVSKQPYGPYPGENLILRVRVTDIPGVTPGVDKVGAVALNVTVTDTEGPGFVTVYPCGDRRPGTSNLNFVAKQTVPNLVIAPVDDQGRVCLYSSARTNLIADISGWFYKGVGMAMAGSEPTRLFDTRPGEANGAAAVQKIPVGPNNILKVKVAGRAGVPLSGVGAVALNVTATESGLPGFVTVFPCGDLPMASSVNFAAGQTVPNSVIAPVSANGEVCFFANTNTHLVADVSAWFAD